jgi:hypothetical protein
MQKDLDAFRFRSAGRTGRRDRARGWPAPMGLPTGHHIRLNVCSWCPGGARAGWWSVSRRS